MRVVPASQAMELLEALIRHAMADHAAIKPRGFDSARDRAKIHREIDSMLDHYAVLVLEAQLEAA